MKKLLTYCFIFFFAVSFWFKEYGLVTYNNTLCQEYRAVANDNFIKWYLTIAEPNKVLYIKVVDDKGNVSKLENIELRENRIK
ncbi:MAG: hypothetical protein KKA19_05865 [Candidatus Margulisbacteria bacterium]|nr:hypothetical protein [Candidatus Margulisiibacteriota bacterium]